MKPSMKTTVDRTKEFNDLIKKFKHDKVLVGIPAETKPRDATKDGEINNATLFAIANFGSPVNNIPPWPIMALGIKDAQEAIAEQFKLAAIKSLTAGYAAIEAYYERAGIIASTAVKKILNSQTGKPGDRPLEGTLKQRTKGGSKYWLVTGQIRNAITYVVKKGL